MRQACGVIGFSTPASPSPFLTGPAVHTRRRPPLFCKNGFILSELRASTEFLPLLTCPLPFWGSERLPWGCLPSARHGPAASLQRGPILAGRPSSAFRTPSTVSSATGLAGLFHPAATSRVLPPGVSPRAQPYHLVDGRCPLVGWLRIPTNGCPPAPEPTTPPSGPCSVRESVA
jgi:hypothetical protein